MAVSILNFTNTNIGTDGAKRQQKKLKTFKVILHALKVTL
jgi:hypothetical protein